MIDKRELYTYRQTFPLMTTAGGSTVLGNAVVKYEVRRHTDLTGLKRQQTYAIKCTHRLIIPGASGSYNVVPNPTTSSYNKYPALVQNGMMVTPTSTSMKSSPFAILDYSPKTLNTAVRTDLSSSNTNGKETSQQHTSGSSTSQSNSYGGSVSAGFMGDVPSGSISANYEHSSASGSSTSSGTSESSNKDTEASDSTSVSIKDWGSYAVIDPSNQTAKWVWGQEFPWNVIHYKTLAPPPAGSTNSTIIDLPDFVEARLCYGGQLCPPSELSLFGINFITEATWIVPIETENANPDEVTITHTLGYSEASHELISSTSVQVTMNPLYYTSGNPDTLLTYESDSLNLGLLALDPIENSEPYNGAVVGFVSDKFDFPPSSNGDLCKIRSEANNLYITASGFSSAMLTDFSTGSSATMSVQFKIVDTDTDYELFLKHWKTEPGDTPVVITIDINQTPNKDPANSITIHVDSSEGEGGDKNISSIFLRNKDYSSIDYCDHLQLGLNTITITIAPSKDVSSTGESSGYTLRAIAIG